MIDINCHSPLRVYHFYSSKGDGFHCEASCYLTLAVGVELIIVD